MAEDKYKMFRNYMTNELGIGRADIEQWTKEAIADQVQKIAGQINVEHVIKQAAEKVVLQGGQGYGDHLRSLVAQGLAQRISVSIK